MLPVMEITKFSWEDVDALDRYVEVENAVRAADSPWEHPLTRHEAQGIFGYGWDLEPSVPSLAVVDGVVVAVGRHSISDYDNLHLAWLDVHVHPEHRRRGHGSALLDGLVNQVRATGRTSIGTSGWESEGTIAFAARHGLERKAFEVNRRQVLAELDWAMLDKLYGEARAAASAYEVVRQLGRTPEEDLDAVAVMVAAINDAPTDDLDIEDEVFSSERVRAYETAHEGRGITIHRLMARHRETGELAGQTVVGVEQERPHIGEQHDTSVVAAHRGHRLGLLMKLEMNRWLRDSQPQLETIDTWNAESNDFMISVNEALGYRVMGRELALQKSI
jgi:GNAT superfamily N-acetyltransferase